MELIPCLLDQFPDEWELGDVPAFRKTQIVEWIFKKRAKDFCDMSNLPAALRQSLSERYCIAPLQVEQVQGSRDTTRKFLWRLRAGDFVETVSIPASPTLYGERSDRHTLCVSSQVGCAYGCRFCASGLDGWKRNLTPGEIVAQVMEVERETGRRADNLVFMGMGEPLANYKNLMKAIGIIHAEWGIGIGARHITISTSGLAPLIRKLADEPLQLRLAISLHGATDDVRGKIMPVNEKYPLAELIPACMDFVERRQKMITFEFILIKGVNDTIEQARALSELAKKCRAKVNLIPYNRVEGLDWERPDDRAIDDFHAEVCKKVKQVTLRREKGHDIDAACGQLRLKKVNPST